MRVLVDALTAREGGGITYVRQILPALVRAAPHHEWSVLLSPQYQPELITSLPRGVTAIPVALGAGALPRRFRFQQLGIRRIVRRLRSDVLFTVTEVAAISPGCAHVVLARNLSVFESSGGTSLRARVRAVAYALTRSVIALRALKRATRVVFVSAAFRDRVAARSGVDESRTSVIHHGVSAIFTASDVNDERDSPLPDHAPRRPYVLHVGTIASHKGVDTLVAGYARAFASRADAPPLVLAGAVPHEDLRAQLLTQIRAAGIEDRVHFVGRVPYERLPAVYRGASVFVLASRKETFGQPLLEAMACGVPVIATGLPACREVCGDAARYFEPGDADALARALTDVADAPALQAQMRASSLARSAAFSWAESARRLVAVLEDAVREHAKGAVTVG